MRYKKLSFLLVVSLVFFLVLSLGMICAWFYYYFRDNKKPLGKNPAAISLSAHREDTVQKMYTASLGRFDTAAVDESTDSLRADFNSKLSEFYRLRNEITRMIRSRSGSGDLELAREKIGVLQQKIDELRSRTTRVEFENRRLNAMLQQLSSELKAQESLVKHNPSPAARPALDKPTGQPAFAIADFRISTIGMDQEKEIETSEAARVDRITGSFTVRNNSVASNGNEVMVVVLQPDGRVLQSSGWESGAFESREGKRIYSAKIVFDYSKGELKRLSFSVKGDVFEKGEYAIQLYQNGVVVGKAVKTLF